MFKKPIDLEKIPFEQIPDDTIIWRYMPLDKFKSILESKSLFFTKVSHFHKDDPFEGCYNQLSKEYYINSRLLLGETPESIKEDKENRIHENAEALFRINSQLHNYILVNCWHINNEESAKMWKKYSDLENGIAIRTTYGNLKDSFLCNEKTIYGSKVNYIDPEKFIHSFGNIYLPFIAKRQYYKDEKELRILINISNESNNLDWAKERFDNGRLISCNINSLIESVFVSPNSTEDFRRQTQMAIDDSGMLGIDVKKGKIYYSV